ncbi:GntR family transcriptional regulator [Microbacterium sp. TPU 3598]|uniref:GntR family transcriptional regulator n=1 Tax=Microbacterium sp. TPU 3598 TaxID=1938334 RepID=UPI000BBB0B0B|nr:GntR family transcriptional regulator [Microbacterium sp. TPU 3598]
MPAHTSYTHSSPQPTLSEQAFEFISASILRGDYSPGERLRDDELTGRLGVSRSPVREALLRLQHAGLVETAPSRYTRVTDFSAPNRPDVLPYAGRLVGFAFGDLVQNLDTHVRELLIHNIDRIASAASIDARAGALGALMDTAVGLIQTHLHRAHLIDVRLAAECSVRFGPDEPPSPVPLSAACLQLASALNDGDRAATEVATTQLFAAVRSR